MPATALSFASAATQQAGMVLSVAELLDATKKEKQAKKELDRLKTPFYKIQDEYFQNKNLAAGLAGSGLPQSTKDYADIERERGLSTGIGALLQSGASPNDISSLLGTYNLSVDRTAAEDAQTKMENIKYFMKTNADLAGQKTIQWAFNEAQPYERKLKEITDRRAAAEQNKLSAINLGIGSLSAAGTSLQNSDLNPMGSGDSKSKVFNQLFKTPGVSSTNPTNDMQEKIFNQLYGIDE